ncbi:MAG: hypothetical protein A2W80_07075 [Candidatus Riflebacteria bacterium GWC2_50_8]|nr:MAG: hypothetical protein A2W80_07075 [Candidatus Riflebacteria bacterium GWC2_50_8]
MNNIKSPLTNIMKIMNIVIKRIETSGIDEKDPIVSKLLEKGYRLDDIDTAMNLVAMLTSRVDPIVRVSERECSAAGEPRGIRHLHATEAVRLSPDAQQLMLKLVEDGIISQLHFEKALEYIWKNDMRQVSASRMELIVLMTKPMTEMESEVSDLAPHSIELH